MELERKKAVLVRFFYYILFAAALYIALRWLWRLLLPFLLGFAVAYMLRPVTEFICRHSKITKRSAAIICAIVFYIIIIGAFWLLGAFFLLQIEQISHKLPLYYTEKISPALTVMGDKLVALIARFFPGLDGGQIYSTLNLAIGEGFVSASSWGMGIITGVAKAAPMAILTFVFTVMSSVLICAEYNGVTRFVMSQIPTRLHLVVIDVRDFLARSIIKIVKTYLILMVITFVILALGMWILKIEDYIVYSAVIAFLDLLPVIGSGAVLIPWSIFLLVTGKSFTGIGLLLLWGFSSIVREFLEPKIIGDQIGLHPLATLTAMYFGLKLAGFGGLIFVPIICLLARHLQDSGVIKLYNKPDDGISIN